MTVLERIGPKTKFLIALAIALGFGWEDLSPCSSLVLQGTETLVFGGNLDFYTSKGLVIANKRGVAKTALLAPPETPASWTSKFGSITFNQVGREFPFGGMNEQGLVIQMMWLEDTEYPEPDERPAVTALQWIQYQLDNSSTVDEVIESDSEVRISGSRSTSKLHYLVCDRKGTVATIEFLEGQLVYRTGQALPVAALTNSTYDDCLEIYIEYDSLTPQEQILRTSYDSGDRFVRISRAIGDFKRENIRPAVEYVFDVLESVSAVKRGSHCTAWSIVYDVANMRLLFKTFENRRVRTIDLREFDFDCSTPVLVMDMDQNADSSSLSVFEEYTPEINVELVTSVMKTYGEAGFLRDVSDMAIQVLAHYPEHLNCE